jgi:redox-sensing transcriptional repressor
MQILSFHVARRADEAASVSVGNGLGVDGMVIRP